MSQGFLSFPITMIKKGKVSPVLSSSSRCCRCEEEQFKILTSDLFKRAIFCIFLVLSSVALAVFGVVVFFSAIFSNESYEYCLALISETSAGLLFYIFAKSKNKISKNMMKMFITFSDRRRNPADNETHCGSCSPKARNVSTNSQNCDSQNIGQWLESFDARVQRKNLNFPPRSRFSLPSSFYSEEKIMEEVKNTVPTPTAPPMSPSQDRVI